MAKSTARVGAAGQFHTAAQLAERGWDASLTIGNTPRTDIIAQHFEHQTLIAVQCKAKTGAYFRLGKGSEFVSPPGNNEWFVLIALNAPTQRPDFFIVPRNVAAAYIYVAHVVWMNSASKSGEPRKENDERDIEPPAVKYYRERWDLLERPSDEVPYWASGLGVRVGAADWPTA